METRLQSKEVRIPKLDFDLTTTAAPCQYFYKSSFARSLTYSNNNNNNNKTNNHNGYHHNQTKSLDFGINYGFNNDHSPIYEEMMSGDDEDDIANAAPTSTTGQTSTDNTNVSKKTNLIKCEALECLAMDDNVNLLWEEKHQVCCLHLFNKLNK